MHELFIDFKKSTHNRSAIVNSMVLAHHAVQLLHLFWSVLLVEIGNSRVNLLGCTSRSNQVFCGRARAEWTAALALSCCSSKRDPFPTLRTHVGWSIRPREPALLVGSGYASVV